MAERVFIIGNGFDLDLNLRTKYSDFYRIGSSLHIWPFDKNSSGLGGYINRAAKNDKWLDLEKLLFDYAKENGVVTMRGQSDNYPIESDKYNLWELKYYLAQYINRIIQEDDINKDSTASKVLQTVLDNGKYEIYSFNYTNLKRIAARLYLSASSYDDKEYDLNYTPVHGTLKSPDGIIDGESIILGVHSDAKLVKGYEFLYKIDQEKYRSHNLLQNLNEAKEIVIFGISMGLIDYPYFRHLFNSLCSGVVKTEEKKHITIFTYDDSSRQETFNQLRQLTNSDLMQLRQNCELQIIRTKSNCFKDKDIFEVWQKRQTSSIGQNINIRALGLNSDFSE